MQTDLPRADTELREDVRRRPVACQGSDWQTEIQWPECIDRTLVCQ